VTRGRILVSSARGRAGTAVLRNLGRGGYDAIGADYGPPPFGLRSRWSSGYRILPRPSNSEALLEALENAGVEAVLPLESRLVGLLATHREQLRKRLALAVPDRQGFLTAYDKRRTVEACGRLGIPAPRILDGPPRPGEVVVVKPRADIGAAQGVAFCRNDAEMAIALTSCRRFGEPLLQEYVPGGVDAMRTVVLLFDRRCRLVYDAEARSVSVARIDAATAQVPPLERRGEAFDLPGDKSTRRVGGASGAATCAERQPDLQMAEGSRVRTGKCG
jgi:hypothetical protein